MNAVEEERKLIDKRKLKRFSDRLKICFNVNGVEYRGLSSNFSLNGLLIRTNHLFPRDTVLDIMIDFPNDLASQLKGKVVRVSSDRKATGYAQKGMGIEIMEKDALYLHFIRSFLSLEGRHIFRQLAFAEQGAKYQEIEAELQQECHLFDVVAIVIGEGPKDAGFKSKAWFEAKITNNTNCVFMEPVVTFMTIKNNEDMQKRKDNRPPEIGVILMSSSDNLSHWKPGETIILDGEIDLSSEDISIHELNFFDYLTTIPEFAADLPISIDHYISTLWIGSPCLDEMGENIPDNILSKLLQPSLPIDKTESGIDDSAKSDDAEPEHAPLLPPQEPVDIFFRQGVKTQACHSQCTSFDSDLQYGERDEALNNVKKIFYAPAIGVKYEPAALSQDDKDSDILNGGHDIAQETMHSIVKNSIVKRDKSVSSVSKWIIFLGSLIIASLIVRDSFNDKDYRQPFIRQTLVISSQNGIAPKDGAEQKEAGQQEQKKREYKYAVETNTSQENKQKTDLQQTRAIQQAAENKDLQNSQSNERTRQNLSTTGRYSIQIGAFKNSSNAKARKANLNRKGYQTFLLTANTKEHQKLFVVLLGKYGTREEARLLLTKLKNGEGLHAFVTDITTYEGKVNLQD
jgi:cell division septation protein DedD